VRHHRVPVRSRTASEITYGRPWVFSGSSSPNGLALDEPQCGKPVKAEMTNSDSNSVARTLSCMTGAHRRTIDAIFRHPSAHNLEWRDVASLIGHIGDARQQGNNEFVFTVAGKQLLMHKPHTKDMTSPDVAAVRQFLMHAGVAAEQATPDPAAPTLLIVVDHHGTKIFHVDLTNDDTSAHVIAPYDPHHFLHHLTHKDQDREQGQRAREEPAYYEKIAEAVALGGQLVVVGHGKGKSNAAHHLTDYLLAHHRETYQRIVREIDTDLSAITTPQLLDLARDAMRT
jgi:hypothetical protein